MTQKYSPAPPHGQAAKAKPKPFGTYAGLAVAGAVVLIAIVALLVWTFSGAPAPTSLTPEMLQMQTVTIAPATFLDIAPLDEGNAGDDYARAVEKMSANKALISRLIGEKADAESSEEDYGLVGRRDSRTREVMSPEALKVLKAIAADVESGARKAKMQYTFVHTPKEFRVSDKFQGAEELHKLSSALDTLAAYYLNANDKANARKVLEAEFLLGWHMMREHTHPDMLRRGLSIQGMALDALQGSLYREDNSDRLSAIQNYNLQRAQLEHRFRTKHAAIWRARQLVGDIFYVAQHDDDPAWRVQAILALGLVRFGGTSGSERELAVKTLQEYQNSDNPLFSAAATAALAMTREQFNQIGAGN